MVMNFLSSFVEILKQFSPSQRLFVLLLLLIFTFGTYSFSKYMQRNSCLDVIQENMQMQKDFATISKMLREEVISNNTRSTQQESYETERNLATNNAPQTPKQAKRQRIIVNNTDSGVVPVLHEQQENNSVQNKPQNIVHDSVKTLTNEELIESLKNTDVGNKILKITDKYTGSQQQQQQQQMQQRPRQQQQQQQMQQREN